jgi:uncharacterized protein
MSGMTGAQLKTLQEVITLIVFAVFATWYLREPLRWTTIAGFALIALGAALVYGPWSKSGSSVSGLPQRGVVENRVAP